MVITGKNNVAYKGVKQNDKNGNKKRSSLPER
jgi:hypothetical protein